MLDGRAALNIAKKPAVTVLSGLAIVEFVGGVGFFQALFAQYFAAHHGPVPGV